MPPSALPSRDKEVFAFDLARIGRKAYRLDTVSRETYPFHPVREMQDASGAAGGACMDPHFMASSLSSFRWWRIFKPRRMSLLSLPCIAPSSALRAGAAPASGMCRWRARPPPAHLAGRRALHPGHLAGWRNPSIFFPFSSTIYFPFLLIFFFPFPGSPSFSSFAFPASLF